MAPAPTVVRTKHGGRRRVRRDHRRNGALRRFSGMPPSRPGRDGCPFLLRHHRRRRTTPSAWCHRTVTTSGADRPTTQPNTTGQARRQVSLSCPPVGPGRDGGTGPREKHRRIDGHIPRPRPQQSMNAFPNHIMADAVQESVHRVVERTKSLKVPDAASEIKRACLVCRRCPHDRPTSPRPTRMQA